MKATAATVVLLLAAATAMANALAQTGAHGAAVSSPRARSARGVPLVLPEQFAPPQEAYASFPEPSTAADAAPPGPSTCQLRLAKIAVFQPLGTLVGPGDCGAPDAVQLQTVVLPDQTKVVVTPPATLRCPMAEQVADWLRDDVAPALGESGPPPRVLDNFDSYECRGRNRVRAAALSEHGRADAIDVRGFRLADGREINLTDISAARDLRAKIRASACARFSTVLGPGSDGYHEQHVHVDLAEHRSGNKMCEWDVREPVKQADNVPLPPDSVPLPRPRPLAANLSEDAHPRSGKTRPQ